MKVYCLGTIGMKEMLTDSGIECLDEGVDCVVLGYDTELTYAKLTKAISLIHQNVPLVATHPDVVCPSPMGGLPDVGSMLKMIELSTGIQPTIITGKPRPEMILGRLEEEGVSPSKVAMIGDRLYTDMEMAKAAGVVSVLVLRGEATQQDVENNSWSPNVIVNSVDDLLRYSA
jgi:ribonucleotide monophosphatase NagD (HAD superfamily)